MSGRSRGDIRSLLKEFGVRADEALVAHLARNESIEKLYIRLELEDLTQYGDHAPDQPLTLSVEGEIKRG